MALPWRFVRRLIAERWGGMPPYLVEDAPADAVEEELYFMRLESEVTPEGANG